MSLVEVLALPVLYALMAAPILAVDLAVFGWLMSGEV